MKRPLKTNKRNKKSTRRVRGTHATTNPSTLGLAQTTAIATIQGIATA
jgi:hypothetical protein